MNASPLAGQKPAKGYAEHAIELMAITTLVRESAQARFTDVEQARIAEWRRPSCSRHVGGHSDAADDSGGLLR